MKKRCATCKQFLSTADFWANTGRSDGLQSNCKRCANLHKRGGRTDWTLPTFDDRACAGEDPELFFPIGDSPKAAAAGKAICGRCPIRIECLRWALRNGEQGIWGGLTDGQRRDLMKRRGAA